MVLLAFFIPKGIAPPPALGDLNWSGIEINFNQTISDLTEQTFIFYIKQNYSQTGIKINLSDIINSTNFPITNLKGMQFFTRENVTYNETVGNTICNPYNETTPNGTITNPNCTTTYSTITKWKWDWVEAKDFLFKVDLTEQKAKSFAKTMTIPKLSDLDEYGNNGTKWFKLIIKTPITSTGSGWGSSGAFALAVTDINETREFHPWWNSSWQLRRNITINNTANANALTDYQVAVNLTYDSDMQPDFSDIRFTWYNSTSQTETEIPYWIESKVNSAWAYVWVKVKQIPASSYATVYVYYKNSTVVSSKSDGDTTFIFFDDFNDNSLNTTKWAVTSGVTEQNQRLEITTDANGGSWIHAETISSFTPPFIIEVKATTEIVNSNAWVLHMGEDGLPTTWGYGFGIVSMIWNYPVANGGAGTWTSPPAPLNYTTYKMKEVLTSSNSKAYINGIQYGSKDFSSPINNAIKYALGASDNRPYYDDFFIRKYASPEPTYSVGAEELSNPPPAYSNNLTSNPPLYDGMTPSWFNATWSDDNCNNANNRCFNVSLLEINYTGAFVNYTMNADGNVSYFKIVLPAGTFSWRIYANDSSNAFSATPQSTFTISKGIPKLTLGNGMAVINTSNLVGYWRFETNNGSHTFDSSGYGNDGKLFNFANITNATVDGRFGKAFRYLNDTYRYVNIPDSDILDFGTSDFSVSFWYKAELPYTQAAPVSKKGSGWNDPGWVFVTSSGSPTISFCGNTNENVCAGWTFGDTNWHHVVGVRIGSSLYIYGDGILRSVVSHSSYANSSSNNEPLRIGYDDGWYNSVNGIIDELMIFNRSLTNDEIKMLYQSRVAYPTQTSFNFSESNLGDADLTYNFFRNQTSVSSPDTVTLGAGDYYYLANTSGGANYTKVEFLLPLTVSKGIPDLKTFIDELTQNKTVVFGSQVTIKGNSTSSSGANDLTFKLYTNNTERAVGNPASTTLTLDIGIYNVIYNTTGGANWTSAQNNSLFVKVEKGPAPLNLLIDGVASDKNVIYPTETNTTGFETNIFDDDLIYRLYRNTSTSSILIGTGSNVQDVITLGAGTYFYVYNTSGGANLTANNITRILTVNRGIPTFSIFGANVTYPTSILVNFSEGNQGDGDVIYRWWRNETNIANGSSATDNSELSVGSYVYKGNTTGGANWTLAQSSNFLFVVSKGNNVNISISASSTSVKYPTNITIIGDEDNNKGGNDVVYKLWRDGVLKNSTTDNDVVFLDVNPTPATYSWKFNSSEGQNWTANDTGVSLTVQITNDPPVVSKPRVYNESLIETDDFHLNELIRIKVNATDTNSDVDKAVITIINPKNEIKVSNQSMTKIFTITDGFTFEFNFTIPNEPASYGLWKGKVYVNDSLNVISFNETAWNNTDSFAPSYSDISVDPPSPIMKYVGLTILFRIKWKDNGELNSSKVLFEFVSTNYTMRNESTNMSDSFWSVQLNESQLSIGTFNYRFYACDTFTTPNCNSTPSFTYTIKPTIIDKDEWFRVYVLDSTAQNVKADINLTNWTAEEVQLGLIKIATHSDINLPNIKPTQQSLVGNAKQIQSIIQEKEEGDRDILVVEVKKAGWQPFNVESSGKRRLTDIFTLDQLSDGSSTKNVDFFGNENKTVYFKLPKVATVLNATLSVSSLLNKTKENDLKDAGNNFIDDLQMPGFQPSLFFMKSNGTNGIFVAWDSQPSPSIDRVFFFDNSFNYLDNKTVEDIAIRGFTINATDQPINFYWILLLRGAEDSIKLSRYNQNFVRTDICALPTNSPIGSGNLPLGLDTNDTSTANNFFYIFNNVTSGKSEIIHINGSCNIINRIDLNALGLKGTDYTDLSVFPKGHPVKLFWVFNNTDKRIYELNSTHLLRNISTDPSFSSSSIKSIEIRNTTTIFATVHNGTRAITYSFAFPLNPYLDTADSGTPFEWSINGYFNETNKVDLNATLINNFLSTCSPDSENNCLVPILLHSDREGTIKISEINITYNATTGYTPEGFGKPSKVVKDKRDIYAIYFVPDDTSGDTNISFYFNMVNISFGSDKKFYTSKDRVTISLGDIQFFKVGGEFPIPYIDLILRDETRAKDIRVDNMTNLFRKTYNNLDPGKYINTLVVTQNITVQRNGTQQREIVKPNKSIEFAVDNDVSKFKYKITLEVRNGNYDLRDHVFSMETDFRKILDQQQDINKICPNSFRVRDEDDNVIPVHAINIKNEIYKLSWIIPQLPANKNRVYTIYFDTLCPEVDYVLNPNDFEVLNKSYYIATNKYSAFIDKTDLNLKKMFNIQTDERVLEDNNFEIWFDEERVSQDKLTWLNTTIIHTNLGTVIQGIARYTNSFDDSKFIDNLVFTTELLPSKIIYSFNLGDNAGIESIIPYKVNVSDKTLNYYTGTRVHRLDDNFTKQYLKTINFPLLFWNDNNSVIIESTTTTSKVFDKNTDKFFTIANPFGIEQQAYTIQFVGKSNKDEMETIFKSWAQSPITVTKYIGKNPEGIVTNPLTAFGILMPVLIFMLILPRLFNI
ncbi:MAG: DUF2341 domain-containing protein [Candidatus Aenigmatarchaeota archaeon]